MSPSRRSFLRALGLTALAPALLVRPRTAPLVRETPAAHRARAPRLLWKPPLLRRPHPLTPLFGIEAAEETRLLTQIEALRQALVTSAETRRALGFDNLDFAHA